MKFMVSSPWGEKTIGRPTISGPFNDIHNGTRCSCQDKSRTSSSDPWLVKRASLPGQSSEKIAAARVRLSGQFSRMAFAHSMIHLVVGFGVSLVAVHAIPAPQNITSSFRQRRHRARLAEEFEV